jgi:hypothetical protein
LVNDGLSAHLTGSINVTDTAADMMAQLGGINSLATAGHLGTLTLTTAPAAFNVTTAQAYFDSTAINDILSGTGAAANETLYIQGSNGGNNNINTSPFTHPTVVSLGTNSSFMSFVSGGAVSTGTFLDPITLGAAPATVDASLDTGLTTINGFQFGQDVLNLAFSGSSTLAATPVTYGGTAAIALTLASDMTHGVLLMSQSISNGNITALSLMTDHQFAAGTHFIVS